MQPERENLARAVASGGAVASPGTSRDLHQDSPGMVAGELARAAPPLPATRADGATTGCAGQLPQRRPARAGVSAPDPSNQRLEDLPPPGRGNLRDPARWRDPRQA